MVSERLVSSSDELAVPFDEVVQHLMLDPEEAAEIAIDLEEIVREATAYVEGQTRRSLLTQTFEQSEDCFPREIELLRWPVQSIAAIEYLDLDGALQTLDPSRYQADLRSMPARIAPAPNDAWPTTADRYAAVVVRYVAGESPIPKLAKSYVKLKTEDLWRVRGTIEVGRRAMLVPEVEDRFRSLLEVPHL